MTNMSLSAIVQDLSRNDSHQAYLLLTDTDQKAAHLYNLVKQQFIERTISHQIIDFSIGLSSLPETDLFKRKTTLLLLENTASVPEDQSQELNQYVKRLTDSSMGPILWYLSVPVLGRLNKGYESRSTGAFQIITKIKT